jgi:hypothetical protein
MSNSKSNVFSAELLAHIFQNAPITGIGSDLPAAGTPGDLYVTLQTADPTDTGDANTSETGYENYLRVAVSRTGATGWTITGTDPSIVSPTSDIDFAEAGPTTPGAPITHFTVTIASGTGADKILYSGTVTPNITMAEGVIPRIKTTSTITET